MSYCLYHEPPQYMAYKYGVWWEGYVRIDSGRNDNIINRITPKDVEDAKLVIFAHDVAIKYSSKLILDSLK